MPELPEVETVVRGLKNKIEDHAIVAFDIRDNKVVRATEQDLVGRRVSRVWRRAKNIIFDLIDGDGSFDSKKSGSAQDFGEKALLFHLKMTGQLIWEKCAGEKDFCLRNRSGLSAKSDQTIGLLADGGPARNATQRFAGGHPDKAWLEKLPNKHTRAIFTFDDGGTLYFNDIRRFGYLKPLKNGRNGAPAYDGVFELLGPEPLEDGLTPKYLQKMAERFPNRKIKQFIMDQTIIAGVGNIYADEALFAARIAPMRLAKDINKNEWPKLIKSIRDALQQGIKYGGSSSENFVDAFGQQGKAHEYLKVYRKTGERCPNRCGGIIERTVIGGRGTHWCPACQR